MDTRKDVQRGDTLLIVRESGREIQIMDCTVINVDQKHITVTSDYLLHESKFFRDTWQEVGVIKLPDCLYESEEAWKKDMYEKV